jgi:hypothetical protein
MKTLRLLVVLLPTLSACGQRGAPSAVGASQPSAQPSLAAKKPQDMQMAADQMRSMIETAVSAGFENPDRIVDSAVSLYSDTIDEAALIPTARKLVDEALANHRKAQATWPAVTDCDRLDHAFADLESQGIVARQNFSDCGTCGVAEIQAEMEAARKGGRKVRGYAFYHMQDTESAVDGSGLYLNYGSVDDGEPAQLGIGREIVQALKQQGLETKWNGKLEQRIGAKLDWKRRR